jgi:aryl-alcohol dehydrogenase-like predicted oxidoreductase
MEFRQLGGSGLKVPVLSVGTAAFGKDAEMFSNLERMVDIALEAGANLFDTADVYSKGASEEALGKAIKGKRANLLLATKATFTMSKDPNDVGSSRHHLIKSVDDSLRRLGTDYIDLYQMHSFDAIAPIEETLNTLDDLVRSGKIRYVGCSNFSGWHLMKSLAISEKYNLPRYASHQVYYSLVGRDYEYELMPLGLDQRVGAMIWSPLGWGRLTGKIRRGQPMPPDSRMNNPAMVEAGPLVPEEYLYKVVDAIDEVAAETGKTVPQIALNWLLQRPTVATVVVGARNEEQLRQNLEATGWNLTQEQIAKLDAASQTPMPYPYWHQYGFHRNPFPVRYES